jgi:hypothetical protein
MSIALHCTSYTAIHYKDKFKCNYNTTPHYTRIRYTRLHYTTYVTLQYIALHFIFFPTLHYITLQLQLRLQVQLPLHYTCAALHCAALHHTTPHYTYYTAPHLQLQPLVRLRYTDYTTSQIHLHYTTVRFQVQLQLRYLTIKPAVVVE